jgi:hypothetical protein
MLKILIVALGASAAAHPQARVAVRLTMPAHAPSPATLPDVEAARPLLGYVSEGSNTLYSVVGSSASPAWGEPISLPDAASQAFLPPRQEYALVASDAGLSAARLSSSALHPGPLLSDAIARPDRVAFSPMGSAAVLVSNSEYRMQAITYRSGNAVVLWSLSLSDPGELMNLAISDDGELAVATVADRPPLYSLKGSEWQPLAANCAPRAWTFLPGSHDLVLSDRLQNAIVLLPRAESGSIAARVLLPEGGDADLIAADKQGVRVLAAMNGRSALWQIDLGSGTTQQLLSRTVINTLTLLRDGETFLISAQGFPELLTPSGDRTQFRSTPGVR